MSNDDVKQYGFSGNLTLTSSSEVNEILESILQEKAPLAIISMKEVERVDSSGLGAIFRLQGELKRQGILFAFIDVASQPRHLFNFSMLDKLVPIFETREEAVASLLKPQD